MSKQWTADELMELSRSFQAPCVIAAAVDHGVFDAIDSGATDAESVATRIGADPRATRTLLDALVPLQLLAKEGDLYTVPPSVADLLTESSPQSVLPMARHHGNCLRRWAQLPQVVQAGAAVEAVPSIRGADADQAAFIGGMHNVSIAHAPIIAEELKDLPFSCFLDVGGGPATWTIAMLRAHPEARAILFDLPHVVPMAKQRIAEAGMSDRVELVVGDFYTDPLPTGADLAWLGAIIHQNSDDQNRDLYRKAFAALEPGGQVLVRDTVMEESRTEPIAGALFAINMLVATPGGGTYTFGEITDGLQEAGFVDVSLLRRDPAMNALVRAVKPA